MSLRRVFEKGGKREKERKEEEVTLEVLPRRTQQRKKK